MSNKETEIRQVDANDQRMGHVRHNEEVDDEDACFRRFKCCHNKRF